MREYSEVDERLMKKFYSELQEFVIAFGERNCEARLSHLLTVLSLYLANTINQGGLDDSALGELFDVAKNEMARLANEPVEIVQ